MTDLSSVVHSLGDHLADFYNDNETTTMGAFEVIRPSSNPRHGITHSHSNLSIGFTSIPGQPQMTLSSFAHQASGVIEAFLTDFDSAAAVAGIKSLECNLYHDLLIAKCIVRVLNESEDVQSRMASFLTVLYDATLISRPQVTRGFEKLIQSAESLHSGISNVEDKLFSFISVAVEDKVVDSDYLLRLPEALVNNLSASIVDNEPMIPDYLKTLREYKARCRDFMPEFFASGEAAVVQEFFEKTEKELFPEASKPVEKNPTQEEESVAPIFPPCKRDTLRHEFVRRLIVTSLGMANQQREMVSKVLSDLFVPGPYSLSPDDIQIGMLRLLAAVQDITLDVPLATEMISNFVVRLVVDDVLPPAFVSDFLRLSLADSLGVAALRRAFRWMTDSARHHLLSERFTKVWTGTDGARPEVEEFKRELRDIIFDYFNTADVQTALTLINGLDMSPDQEVEAVRKLVVFALERHADSWALSVGLLMTLRDEKEIDAEAVQKGFNQIKDRLPDIMIDCPSARETLESYFIPECKRLALIPECWSLSI